MAGFYGEERASFYREEDWCTHLAQLLAERLALPISAVALAAHDQMDGSLLMEVEAPLCDVEPLPLSTGSIRLVVLRHESHDKSGDIVVIVDDAHLRIETPKSGACTLLSFGDPPLLVQGVNLTAESPESGGECSTLLVSDPDPHRNSQVPQCRLRIRLDADSTHDLFILSWAAVTTQPSPVPLLRHVPLLDCVTLPACIVNRVYGVPFFGRVQRTPSQRCWVSVPGGTSIWDFLCSGVESTACVWQPSLSHVQLKSCDRHHATASTRCGCLCPLIFGIERHDESGCAWFLRWIDNVERARALGQELMVIYHTGALRNPRGPDAMDATPFEALRKIATKSSKWRQVDTNDGCRRHLGKSQRLEVAWLRFMRYQFTAVDHDDVFPTDGGLLSIHSSSLAPVGGAPGASNGRFDGLPSTGLRPNWRGNMIELSRRQYAIGLRKRPVMAVWNVDVATDDEIEALALVVRRFLSEVRAERVMLSGRRASSVATPVERLLRRALGRDSAREESWPNHGSFLPSVLVTGGADGVDSVALKLAHPARPLYAGLRAIGQYTPTPFARADVPTEDNPFPMELCGLTPGWSPLVDEGKMPERVPELGEPELDAFLALMEGQWEARDTCNAEQADACLAFLSSSDQRTNGLGPLRLHDGTKATLNIFTEGQYAHPLQNGIASQWEDEGVLPVGGDAAAHPLAVVGYKIVMRGES